jgi:hypothetical protein
MKRIFLDLDGVCNRLIMHSLEVNHCGVTRYDDALYPLPGEYDIVAVANYLLAKQPGQRLVTTLEYWGNVSYTTWAFTPQSAEFERLFRLAVEMVGQRNVYFFTAPTDFDECAAGKMHWIRRNAPACMRRQFMIGSPKELAAKEDHLLIDDSDTNVETFRAEGGQVLLLPRRWNSRHAEAPDVIFDEVRELCGANPATEQLQTLGLVPRLIEALPYNADAEVPR